jgi:hypothetical protein
MFTSPPPLTKPHWVYDDPSGVAEPATTLLIPTPYRTRVRNVVARRSPVNVRRTRIVHREA